MKLKFPLCCFLFVSIPLLTVGCATLPDVSAVIYEAPTTQPQRQIVSSKGLLSQQQSKSLTDRLKRSVNLTDVLERHTVVVESVTDSPLTKGKFLLTDIMSNCLNH